MAASPRTLVQLLQHAPTPAVVAGVFVWAKDRDESLAANCVLAANAPAAVLDAARTSRNPALRTAYLLRPNLSTTERTDALDRERRGDVLAALAMSDDADEALLLDLAKLKKQPVAWALCERATLASETAYRAIATVDRFADKATQSHQRALYLKIKAHPELASKIAGITNSIFVAQALWSTLRQNDIYVDPKTQFSIAGLASASTDHGWRHVNQYRTAITDIASYPYLDNATAVHAIEIDRGRANRAGVASQLQLVATGHPAWSSASASFDLLEEATTTDDADNLNFLFVSGEAAGRGEPAGRRIIMNPATPCTLLATIGTQYPSLAVQASQQTTDITALVTLAFAEPKAVPDICGRPDVDIAGFTDALWAKLAERPDSDVAASMKGSLQAAMTSAIQAGAVDATKLRMIPWQLIESCYESSMYTLLADLLTCELTTDEAWELFATLCYKFEGTTGQLLDSVAAALGASR